MKIKLLRRICVGLLTLLMFGCTFYRTKTQDQASFASELIDWKRYIKDQTIKRPIIHVTDGTGHYLLTLSEVNIVEDPGVMLGTLTQIKPLLVPANFRLNQLEPDLRKDIHRFLKINTQKRLEEGAFIMAIPEIESITYYDIDAGREIGSAVLVGTGVGVLGVGALLAIACNCPHVYAVGPEGPTLQGSLLTGAIAKSLTRTDYLPLEEVKPVAGEIHITVKNELPEIEYLDQLRLLTVRPTPGAQLGIGVDGKLFEYQDMLPVLTAQSGAGRDIAPELTHWDEQGYAFDEMHAPEGLTTATLTFDKSSLNQDQAQLIIKARQTEWLETVAESFFQLFGTDFGRWVKRLDRVPAQKYEARMAERGVSMNAYLKTSTGWKLMGTYHNAGVIKQKTLGIPLDLSQALGDYIEIKLTSAYRFWELDQIGLSQTARPLVEGEEAPLLEAIDLEGQDVREFILHQDHSYVTLPNAGDQVSLRFAATAGPNDQYILSGTGYYHHIRGYTHEPNKQMLKAMKNGELTTHQLSQMLEASAQISQN